MLPHEQESWDSDPDLDLPSGPLALHLSASSDSSDLQNSTEESSEMAEDWDNEEGHISPTGGGGQEAKDSGAQFKEDDTGSGWTEEEEEDNQKTIEANGSTIKAFLNNFSALSLAGTVASSESTSTPTRVMQSRSTADQNTPTLRQPSQFFKIPSADTSGKVTYLGSNADRRSISVEGDWDEDLDLDSPNLSFSPPLRAKASFASHISDDSQDELLGASLPTPQTNRKVPLGRQSIYSATEDEDEDVEDDFDLPTEMAQFTLSPHLSLRPSNPNLVLAYARTSSSASLQLPMSTPVSMESPIPSWNEVTEEGGDDDDAFFEELVIPSYFLGGPGAMTPPSDGELGRFGGKIDLQGMLKQKLEARGREVDERDNFGRERNNRLKNYRESNEDMEMDDGFLEIDPIDFGTGRMRTKSEVIHSGLPLRNRLPSASRRQPSSTAGLRSPGVLSPTTTRAVSLKRSGTFPQGIGWGRPISSHGPAPASPTISRDRRPPASSTRSSRDRVHSRTASVQPLSSGSNVLDIGGNASFPLTPRRPPPRIDTTLASPTPTRTLGSKKSLGNLSATHHSPSGIRSLERKRSLGNLSSASRPTSQQSLRPPTPGSSVPNSPVLPQAYRSSPSFSAGTTASTSRARERVLSGASSGSFSSASSLSDMRAPTTPRPRPNLTSRLSQPTLASKAKARTTSLDSSYLAGITIPPTPINFSRPKRQRQYGDGTELEGFDDLPTSRDRERERTMKPKIFARAVVQKGSATSVETPQPPRKKLVKRNFIPESPAIPQAHSSTEDGSTIKASATIKARAKRADSVASSSSSIRSHSILPAKIGKGDSVEQRKDKRSRGESVASGGAASQRKVKKEPHLIRNLGTGAMNQVQGEMTWNPALQRWEGNDSALRDFDRILTTSTRPALITQLSASPIHLSHPLLPVIPSTIPSAQSRANNVKVVGSMVFDPISMAWYSLAPEGEDELDFMSGFGDEESTSGDTSFEDGWEKGEHERMLKSRASFVSMSDGRVDSGGGSSLKKESEAAEKRCREEMKGWEMEGEVSRDRLWDIRRLITEERSSPPR